MDDSIQLFAFQVLEGHVNAILNEMDGVRQAKDIECIHRMRVASRRLRNALYVFSDLLPVKKRTRWLIDLKSLTRSLGAARDLDVQMEIVDNFIKQNPTRRNLPGARRLHARLGHTRRRLQKKVLLALDDVTKSGKLLEMQKKFDSTHTEIPNDEPGKILDKNSTSLYYLAVNTIFQRLEKFLAYEINMYDPTKIKELHAMRIQAKWLRYTMEIFAGLYPDRLENKINIVRTAQDYLGQIHDCDVWAGFMPHFIEREFHRSKRYYGSESPFHFIKPGLEAFLQERTATRQHLYQDFLKKWEMWRKKGVWDELRLILTQPLTNPTNILGEQESGK